MDIWDEIKKLTGYQSGNGGVDSYGVDHSGFSTRDELEYQSARLARENQLAEGFAKQGIAEENYPQYGTNFWGGSPENNYGFGTSNISQNIQNVTNQLNNSGVSGGTNNSTSGGFNGGTNNGHAFANSDYTVNTESLVGKPSSYFQNNNTGNILRTNQSLNTTPTPWSTTTAIQTPWNNGATYPRQSPTVQNTNNDNIEAQKQAQALQKQRNAVNQILMNGMDVLYGMNRTINGMTFGGLDYLGQKLGFDSQMNNYLQLKNPQERELAQNVGQYIGYGGNALTGGALAKAGLNQANMAYNGYKIGKKYDQLVEDPFQGNGSDVIARMKNHNGEPVVLQRGEAIQGPNGEVLTSGRNLQRATGTERNYGLDKIIYKHEMPRNEVTQIPRYIKQNQPVEISQRGQNVYVIRKPNGEIKIVTTPRGNYSTISSMYIKNR